jgi:hypothetical protein
MEVLGVTLESTEGAVSEGTLVAGAVVAPSVITDVLLDPQLVQGALSAAGLV